MSSGSIGAPNSRHSGINRRVPIESAFISPPRYTQSWHTPKRRFRERQEGSPTEFATLYRIEFWKMDLGAFTGRGQGGPCLTDAAQ